MQQFFMFGLLKKPQEEEPFHLFPQTLKKSETPNCRGDVILLRHCTCDGLRCKFTLFVLNPPTHLCVILFHRCRIFFSGR